MNMKIVWEWHDIKMKPLSRYMAFLRIGIATFSKIKEKKIVRMRTDVYKTKLSERVSKKVCILVELRFYGMFTTSFEHLQFTITVDVLANLLYGTSPFCRNYDFLVMKK